MTRLLHTLLLPFFNLEQFLWEREQERQSSIRVDKMVQSRYT